MFLLLEFFVTNEHCQVVSSVHSEKKEGTHKNPSNGEQTLVMIKTEGVQRGLIGEVVRRFEKRGFKLAACRFMSAGLNNAEIPGTKTGDPVVAMVWEGLNVVEGC